MTRRKKKKRPVRAPLKVPLRTWAFWVRAIRRVNGMNQTELARHLGTTQSRVSKMEDGKLEPGGSDVFQLANLICDPEWVKLNVQSALIVIRMRHRERRDARKKMRRRLGKICV